MSKRKLVSASAAAMMVFGISPASAADLFEPALPDLSFVMSVYGGGAAFDTFGGTSTDSDFDAGSHWLVGGDARVAAQSWQLEVVGSVLGAMEDCGSDSFCSEEGSNYFALGGHWLGRGPDGTWGVFAGFGHAEHQESDETTGHIFGGLEYAHFSGSSTFFGQIGGTGAVAGSGSDTWAYGGFGRIGWRYFFTEATKLEIDGLVGFGTFDDNNSSGSSGTGVTAAWGVELENQFAAPFSGFIAYRGHYVESKAGGSDDDEIISHALLVGFRIDVNSDSLLQRDRTGAGTFNLPDLHRAYAWPDQL